MGLPLPGLCSQLSFHVFKVKLLFGVYVLFITLRQDFGVRLCTTAERVFTGCQEVNLNMKIMFLGIKLRFPSRCVGFSTNKFIYDVAFVHNITTFFPLHSSLKCCKVMNYSFFFEA